MHSIGSVRPVPRVSSHWWNNIQEPNPQEPELKQMNQEPGEDVVVIQEEEMVLVRNDPQNNRREPTQEEAAAPVQEEAAAPVQEAPQPKCTEPESTTSAPPLSKSKPKKKQHKRK